MKKLFDFHRASWRLLATLLAVLGFAGVTTVVTTSAAQASDLGGPIARSEVIWRAQYWVDHQPGPYNQGAFSPGPGGDKSYRRDCSGYVSMAWHLNDNPWTGSLAGYAHEISRGDLKPGDIMLFAGTHTFLFDHWTDNNGNFVYYSFGSTPVKHRSANIGSASLDGHPNGSYRAYRYNKIIDDLPGKKKFVDMDFSGDGSADLLSTT
ncbi:NlpC/P60 family protein, partial [Amycolatopsis samaneae]